MLDKQEDKTQPPASTRPEPQPVATQRSDAKRGRISGRTARGLSGRLLVLTIIFVMIAEVLIFVPSVANFRNVWLQNHLDTAESASIVYLDETDTMLSEEAQLDLLKVTESLSVSILDGSVSRLMAATPPPQPVSYTVDLGSITVMESLRGALSVLFFGGDKTYRVMGPMKSRIADIQLVQEDRYLRSALLTYSRNILLVSLLISLITAGLVFLALYWLIVRPIIRLSANMDAFSRNPEVSALVHRPSGRGDEIGLAEERLSALQTDLQATLRQKQRLADLGLAVSKINHDLRNILASAQLFSDRLTDIADPTVQRLAPKLVRTIDRAVEYTRSVLAYGRAVESGPSLLDHDLRAIVEDVYDTLAAGHDGPLEWINNVPNGMTVRADSEQLFRAMFNLCRNAVQAMEAGGADRSNRLEINARSARDHNDRDHTEIRVTDNGPGIPEAVRDKLFTAFQGSSKSGGTGLGLAIASELICAHGGSISLETTGPSGSCFLIRLPAA